MWSAGNVFLHYVSHQQMHQLRADFVATSAKWKHGGDDNYRSILELDITVNIRPYRGCFAEGTDITRPRSTGCTAPYARLSQCIRRQVGAPSRGIRLWVTLSLGK